MGKIYAIIKTLLYRVSSTYFPCWGHQVQMIEHMYFHLWVVVVSSALCLVGCL